jgi:hypothetical protein
MLEGGACEIKYELKNRNRPGAAEPDPLTKQHLESKRHCLPHNRLTNVGLHWQECVPKLHKTAVGQLSTSQAASTETMSSQ